MMIPVFPLRAGRIRHKMNALDNAKEARVTDALLNYETIKYFTAEGLELAGYDGATRAYQVGRCRWQLAVKYATMALVQLMNFCVTSKKAHLQWRFCLRSMPSPALCASMALDYYSCCVVTDGYHLMPVGLRQPGTCCVTPVVTTYVSQIYVYPSPFAAC